MKRILKYSALVGLIVLSISFLAGCGKTEDTFTKEHTESTTDKMEEINYIIRETAIPNPYESIEEILLEGGHIQELNMLLSQDTIYRLVQFWEEEDGMPLPNRYYIQELAPPYMHWNNYRLSAKYWGADTEHDIYSTTKLYNVQEDTAFCGVYCGYKDEFYIGSWTKQAEGILSNILPEKIVKDRENNAVFVSSQGDYYIYHSVGQARSTIMILDNNMQEIQCIDVQGQILGILQNPKNEEIYWYGINENGVGVWSISSQKAYLNNFTENLGYDICIVFSDKGELYITDNNKIWSCDEKGNVNELLDFEQNDYLINEIYGMTVKEDGTIILLARCENSNYYILSANRLNEPLPQKQTIVLATTDAGVGDTESALLLAVTRFNRQNEKYKVKLLKPERNESFESFFDEIPKKILAGEGPDIVSQKLINPTSYARNGYIQNVEELELEGDDYWQQSLDCGLIENVQYGIPYECKLHFATYSQELTKGYKAWNLDEMIEAVKKSDAIMLQGNLTATEIVLFYGLFDNDNKAFIDWENGESHLEKEAFQKLLEFAKEYEDKRKYSEEEMATMLQEGKIAAEAGYARVNNLKRFAYLEACFKDNPSYIGYPSTHGNGIYVVADCLYVSSVTQKKEGCLEFLRFLLSENIQKDMVAYGKKREATQSIIELSFPVRKSALEETIYYQKTIKGDGYGMLANGTTYDIYGLTEKREQDFRTLVEKARPGNWYAMEIESMVFEELQPYFEGTVTAQVVAEKLDNRVQLYLDERK